MSQLITARCDVDLTKMDGTTTPLYVVTHKGHSVIVSQLITTVHSNSNITLKTGGATSLFIDADRPKHAYLNPMTNSRIRSRRGSATGGDGVWVESLFYTGFQGDLRSLYILSILLLISYLSFTSGLSFFLLLKLSGLGRVSTV